MTVSVAIIVKNGERTLGRCLDSLDEHVDEIVVVDTGSDDATRAIARRYTDSIHDFAWCDDFAAARQYAFD
jgi:glycosyltransferase involved in cell wall biosynthesis